MGTETVAGLEMVVPLRIDWRHVLFANWPMDPAVVDPHLPDALDVDTHDGRAWFSTVLLANENARHPQFPSAAGYTFPGLNVRTYVAHEETPGVYFFGLDADNVASVVGARLTHYLPYYYARVRLTGEDGWVRFASKRLHPGARAARFRATYRPTGGQFYAERGTLAEFVVDRYRYYTETPSGAIRYADVDHGPWPLYDVRVDVEENTVFDANRFDEPEGDPTFLYSPGVDAAVSKSKPLNGVSTE